MLNVIKKFYYGLIPLLILLFFAVISSLLGYLFLMLAGDVISLRKIVSRGSQIFLLLSIFPLRRYLKLNWGDIGFSTKSLFFRQVFKGLALGMVTLLPVILVLYALDISLIEQSNEWDANIIFNKTLLSFLLAILIGLGEEPVFRGILLAGLRNKLAVGFAATISAGYYSAFHFIKTKTDIPYEELTISSGFKLMLEAFANLLNPDILSALIPLFVIGLFLVSIRIQIKNSIGICIGCHAAWVWQIKMHMYFFYTNHDSPYYYLVSDYYNDGIVGPLVAVWLSLAILAYIFWKRTWGRGINF